MRDKGFGGIKHRDRTWTVAQSEAFHEFCYNEGYKAFKIKQEKEKQEKLESSDAIEEDW